MNRKERRAAQKQGRGGAAFGPASSPAPAVLGANLFASAVQHFRSGQMAEAERNCRDVLTVAPDHADALHLLGMIAHQAGHYDAALELIGKAVALNPRNAHCRFNLAQVFRALGRLDDAADQLTQVTVLKRDYAAAHLQLADMFLQQGRFEQAVTHYHRLLTLKPSAEACSNLGIALASQGKWDEAAAQYRRALALNPELVDVYRNLGRVLLTQGDAAQALTLARRALALGETEETKVFFAQCAKQLPAASFDDDLRALIARALSEGWSRPSELSALAAELVKQRVGCAQDGRDALAGDGLLRALLETAPVRDIELERTLTAARNGLLAQAIAPESSCPDDTALNFFCALARQCFINEYVFERSDEETRQLQDLLETLEAALQTGETIPAVQLIAAAAYVPLHSLSRAEALPMRSWPGAIAALVEQQVREPLQEGEIRSSIPAL